MNDVTKTALFDELEKIGGWGGAAMNFLKGGVGAIKSVGSKAGRGALMGETKALPGQLSRAWKGNKGWDRAKQVGNVLRYSAPAQAAALGAGGLYAGGKLLGGGQQKQQQPRY